MTILKSCTVTVAAGLITGLVFAVAPAKADLIFDLSEEFSGATDPAGTPPWLRATFSNTGSGEVTLLMQDLNLSAGEFVSEWYFNLDPALDPTKLLFSNEGGVVATVSTGTDAFKADGDGFFDILFDFPNGPPAARFTVDSESLWTITYDDILVNLTAAHFDFSSTPQQNQTQSLLTAAHVQGIGGESGWVTTNGEPPPPPFIPIAEPFPLAAIGLGLIVFGLIRRRMR